MSFTNRVVLNHSQRFNRKNENFDMSPIIRVYRIDGSEVNGRHLGGGAVAAKITANVY